MSKKLFTKSFGCQMNEYDVTKIVDILAKTHNFITVENPAKADLIILNTCSVRAKATEKVFSELGRLKLLKQKNPNLILAVGGCVSREEQVRVFKRAPHVDIIFSPQTLHRLPKMYERSCNKEKHIIDIFAPPIEKFDYLPPPIKTGPIAYISIMEGCNKFCSYCIVPYTRGRETSRKMTDIITEVGGLAQKGAKEIHLLGQNVNAYHDQEQHVNLAELIHEIAKIENIIRIRFTTSHPKEFSDNLIAAFKHESKLANHIHLPIQSGSNRILQLMRRGYTREEYQEIVAKLRKVRPNISISTDFIVGFPNETAEDFALTMDIIHKINFDAAFSFIYSSRPNTPAAQIEDNVTLGQKKERLAILQNQLMLQSHQYGKNMIDTIQKVLVTDLVKAVPHQFSGRTENNRIVNFISPKNVLGKIVELKITEAFPNSLYGEIYTKPIAVF
ncbi:MAG: tRNA (N6-isopentenyl adenosine(37)-C2)-methylthiotransferase MiaB [Coxiellaceae bacterium]|jgi:tRNA-2-methylthio-N6-dimethylallyladenosine synthase|nr:tRNA (N6-isopentenyl adenosine(37)-C2)-methylthiotransferase MiaB [Coxiellaceae bacterium]